MSFNLVTQRWIPALGIDGSRYELSLRDCFVQGEQVRKISAELPTQSFAILRVLLAICHDAIGFHTEEDIEDLLDGGIDVSTIVEYLESMKDRFDIFHAERPFFQVADLHTSKNEVAGLEKIIADIPNGDPFLTSRGGEALERIPASEAALWLVHTQAFDPSGIRAAAVGDPHTQGGRGYPIGPAWAGQVGGVVLHGPHLLKTLALNIVATAESDADRPVWAQPEAQTQLRQLEPQPKGPVELLTWQSRRVRLVGDASGVTGVVLCQGDKMTPQNRQGLEAMTAWRYSEPQTKKLGYPVFMPKKHDPSRSAWRGLPNILAKQDDGKGRATLPPGTVQSLHDHAESASDVMSVVVETVGIDYGPNEATVAACVYDQLDLRASLLSKDAVPVVTMVHDAVSHTDAAVYAVGRLGHNLSASAGDFDGLDGAATQAKMVAWAELDAEARRWLASLDAASDPVEAHRRWQTTACTVLQSCAQRLVEQASPAAIEGRKTNRGFICSALSEIYFNKALCEALPLAEQYAKDKEESPDD